MADIERLDRRLDDASQWIFAVAQYLDQCGAEGIRMSGRSCRAVAQSMRACVAAIDDRLAASVEARDPATGDVIRFAATGGPPPIVDLSAHFGTVDRVVVPFRPRASATAPSGGDAA